MQASMLTLALLTSTPAAPVAQVALNAPIDSRVSSVATIQSLAQIPRDQPSNTLILFDIDDTLIDAPYMLASKAWRSYIVKATKEIDPDLNWHDILSYHLARYYPVHPVETLTSQYVHDLQSKGHVLCGLTSRERQLWYDMPQKGIDVLTVHQLRSVHVDFHNQRLENVYPDLSRDPEYFHGIFFCNLEPKGNFLSHLLQSASERPVKILFIDDKRSQVESVDTALQELGIPHECYLYTATDEKVKAFNPLIANIQLYAFYQSNGTKVLSDAQAAQIAKDSPDLTAEYYLRAALDLARKK